MEPITRPTAICRTIADHKVRFAGLLSPFGRALRPALGDRAVGCFVTRGFALAHALSELLRASRTAIIVYAALSPDHCLSVS